MSEREREVCQLECHVLYVYCPVRCPELTVTSATAELSITSMSQEVATIRCYSGHHFPDETTEKMISCTSSGSWSEPTVDDCVLS